MLDQLWDRQYQEGRHQLNAGIDQGTEKLRCSAVNIFKLVHAIQFDAPWAPRSTDAGCA